MPHLFRAELHVDATPAEVWATLLDLPGWATWNTVVPIGAGPPAVGAALPLALRVRGLRLRARPRIVACDPERALAWRGGVAGLFTATHGFDLRAAAGGCDVVHHETFDGVLAPLVLALLGRDHGARYAEVNARLAEAVAARA